MADRSVLPADKPLAASLFSGNSNVIDADRLLETTFVRRVEWHEVTGSTNDRALQLAGDFSIETPFLVGATRQVSGRGRGANRWWSSEGTLMFSVLFDMPNLSIPQIDWPQFSLATGLSAAETLEAFLPQHSVGLKWPNDVWLDGRKVCGILIEQPDRAQGRLVAGLGWNVNTSLTTASDELRSIATSMREVTGYDLVCEDVLRCFLQRWEANLELLATKKLDLIAGWSRFCVLRDHRIRVSTAETDLTGVCRGIDADGALIVDNGQRLHRCYAGTVRRE
jgi:BirA family biotin operon repressor/biotin-[acetyl-CoA-carboxylase] ligase